MSAESNQTAQEIGSQPPPNINKGSTINRCTPKKSLESKLWDLLQPVARLWGLITAVGECFSNYNSTHVFAFLK